MQGQNKEIRTRRNVVKGIGLLGLIVSLFLMPPIFDSLLSLGSLSPNDQQGLWLFFSLLLGLSLLLLAKPIAAWVKWAMVFSSFLILIMLELGFRIFFNAMASDETIEFLSLAVNRTDEEFRAYKGHPFTSFIGVEGVTLVGNQRNYESNRFNNVGFLGEDFSVEKDSNTIRIACLGGSTTASGYPQVMEKILNENSDGCSYDVMNFGITYWSTAHSMVNFLLNVVEYQPDYVVIHHAWNDSKVRGTPPEEFRSDYSHEFTYFHEPEIFDEIPIRISAIYRYLKFYHTVLPTWAYIDQSTSVKERQRIEPMFGNLDELKPYKRNIRTILDHAILRGIQPVLTTQPFCTDPNIQFHYAHEHIAQCNTILRELSNEYGDHIVFLDLAREMNGVMNHVFKDVGHMKDDGIRFKAERIGTSVRLDSLHLQR